MTHRIVDGGPAALLEATLVAEGPCLFGVSDDGSRKWLLVWPWGFALRGTNVVGPTGTAVAAVGERVRLGGGEYHAEQYDFLRTKLDAEPPPECRIDEYWLVTSL